MEHDGLHEIPTWAIEPQPPRLDKMAFERWKRKSKPTIAATRDAALNDIVEYGRKAPLLFDWRKAFAESDLPSTARLVLWTVSRLMDTDGTGAYPGQERIAREAGLTLPAVKKHLKLAIERGWLRRNRTHKTRYGVGYAYEANIPNREGVTSLPRDDVSREHRAAKGETSRRFPGNDVVPTSRGTSKVPHALATRRPDGARCAPLAPQQEIEPLPETCIEDPYACFDEALARRQEYQRATKLRLRNRP